MNSLAKIMLGDGKKRIVEFHLKTLFDISNYTGIHSWDFAGSLPIYKPQKSLVDFFIKSLGEIHSLGLDDSKIAREMNKLNVSNLLYSEKQSWTETDVLRVLSAPASGLVIIN